MKDGIGALSEREKETLRLLLAGHDAKSMARDLGLSVHTINDRLREARKKLGVSSSREAARYLGEAEGTGPNFHAPKGLGGAEAASDQGQNGQFEMRRAFGYPLVWLGGGMLIMSLIIAAVALSSTFSAQAPVAQTVPVSASKVEAADAPAVESARAWVKLLDAQNWNESWSQAGAYFQSKISADKWASTIESVRGPLGAVSQREVKGILRTQSLPNAPEGDYRIIKFHTDFAENPDSVETVVMQKDGSAWKVVGYFIR